MVKTRLHWLVNIIFISFVLLLAGSCSENRTEFYSPAEFEQNNSICFIWSTDYYGIIPRLIASITQKDKVTIFLGNDRKNTEDILTTLKKYHCKTENIQFLQLNGNYRNIWIRDYGPLYLVNRMGEEKLLQFRYFWSDPGFITDFASVVHLQVVKSTYNSTGGSREVNGRGTMILCEAHELDVNNPKSRQEIENEMIREFGLKKVIWLKKGIPQDDSFLSGPLYDQVFPKGVNGHVDEFCRFAGPRTILISNVTEAEAGLNPIYREAKKRLDENFEILKNSTDQDGKKFKIIKVPIAPLLISDRRLGPEKRLVASVTSYMNFIISNSCIILPSYVSANSENTKLVTKEENVVNIFQKAFPKREIIRMRADTINYYSGGFHCISIQEPKPPAR